jgi:hypothetical protein
MDRFGLWRAIRTVTLPARRKRHVAIPASHEQAARSLGSADTSPGKTFSIRSTPPVVKHSDLGESALSAPSMMNVEPTQVPEGLGAADVVGGVVPTAVGLAVDVVEFVADPFAVGVPPRGDTSTGPHAVVAAAATRISTSRRAADWYIVIPPSSR